MKKNKIIILVMCLFIIIGIFVIADFFTEKVTTETIDDGFFNYSYGYNQSTQTMTNWDSLSYRVKNNGIIEVRKDRGLLSYFSFALTGTINEENYIRTAEDFIWTWSISNDGDDWTFSAYNNNPNFNWTQIYSFYPDKSMKIKHILTNNLVDMQNTKMWYIHTIDEEERIVFDGNEYVLNLTEDKHFEGNFNSILPKVDIKSKYFFDYSDLVENNFDITDIFLGDGSIINHPNVYIMAVGFTKGEGNFNQGTRVEIDPTIETVESTNDVGRYSSIALDSSGYVHISHFDTTNNELRYCNNTLGSWVCSSLEASGGGDIQTDIAIDSNDKVYISFLNTIGGDLRYCNNTLGSWTCGDVETVGSVGRLSSIAIDSNNKIHISHIDTFGDDTLRYCNNTLGSWTCAELYDSGSDLAFSSSLAIDSNDKVHISFGNRTNNDLIYCNNTLGSWTYVKVDEGGYVGDSSSLAIDSNDKVHISHANVTSKNLRYCNNILGSWTCADVELIGSSGAYTSLTIDSNDKIHINHHRYDTGNHALRYCNNILGSWTCSRIYKLGLPHPTVYSRTLAIKKGRIMDSVSFSNDIHFSVYNDTDLFYILLDRTPPVSSFGINPVDTYNSSNVSLTFDFNVSDNSGNIDEFRLYGNWSDGTTEGWHNNYTNNSFTSNNSYMNISVFGIQEGKFVWGLFCNDTENNTFWSVNRTFVIDETKPTVIDIVPNGNSLTESDVAVDGFTATITFNETMDVGTDPTVTFDPAVATTLTNCDGSWTDSITYVRECDIADGDIESANVDIDVADAKDPAGKTMVTDTTTGDDEFSVDTVKPTVSLITISDASLSESDEGDTITIDLDFSEAMDGGTTPALTFDADILTSGTLTFVGGSSSWIDGDTYRASYTVANVSEEQADVDVKTANAKDSVGNVMAQDTQANEIDVDTIKPTSKMHYPKNYLNTSSDSREFSLICSDTNLAYCTLYGNWSDSEWHQNATNSSAKSGSQTNFTVANLPQGKYKWSAFANDSFGNYIMNDTNRTITVDLTKPKPIFNVSSINHLNSTNVSQTFGFKCGDSLTRIDTIRLYGNWTEGGGVAGWHSNYTNSSYQNDTSLNISSFSIGEGKWIWGLFCNDTVGNFNWSSNRTFTIDETTPTIKITFPTDTLSSSSTTVVFSGVCTDATIEYCILYGNWSDGTSEGWHKNQSNDTAISGSQTNFTVVINKNAKYNWTYWANDSAGNSVFNATNRTLTIDNTDPISSFGTDPINNLNTSNVNIIFEFKAEDSTSIDYIKLYGNWSNQTGVSGWHFNYTNTSYTSGDYLNISVTLNDNSKYVWGVWSNDSANNINRSVNRTLTIDTIDPSVNYNPTTLADSSFTNKSSILVNITASDTNLEYVILNLDGTNESFTTNVDDDWWETKSGLIDGAHTFYGWANDSVGSTGILTSRTVIVDATTPFIKYNETDTATTFNTEVNTTNVSRDWIIANVSVTETNFQNITYTLYEYSTGQINKTSYNALENRINWTGLGEGNYTYNVTIYDKASNINNTKTRYLTLDRTLPFIYYGLNTEDNVTNLSVNYFFTNASYIEQYPNTLTFKVYNTTGTYNRTHYITTNNVTNHTINFTGLIDGVYRYNVSLNDSASNSNTTIERYVRIDTTSPTVTNLAPVDNSEDSDGVLNIAFNVSDENPIANCTVWLDSPAYAETTDTSITRNTTQAFTITGHPEVDILDWFISCTDIFENNVNSTTWQVDTKTGAAPGGGGGGGGGPPITLVKVVALITPPDYDRAISDIDRAKLYTKIHRFCEANATKGRCSQQTDLFNGLLDKIISDYKVSITINQLKMWISQYDLDEIENVDVKDTDAEKWNLIRGEVVEIAKEFYVVPSRIDKIWIKVSDTKEEIIRSNRVLKSCQVVSGTTGFTCEVRDTIARVTYKDPDKVSGVISSSISLTDIDDNVVYLDVSLRIIKGGTALIILLLIGGGGFLAYKYRVILKKKFKQLKKKI